MKKYYYITYWDSERDEFGSKTVVIDQQPINRITFSRFIPKYSFLIAWSLIED